MFEIGVHIIITSWWVIDQIHWRGQCNTLGLFYMVVIHYASRASCQLFWQRFVMRLLLFWVVMQCRLVVVCQCFGTAYQCQMLINNWPHMLHKDPEEWKPHLHCSWSMKSCEVYLVFPYFHQMNVMTALNKIHTSKSLPSLSWLSFHLIQHYAICAVETA